MPFVGNDYIPNNVLLAALQGAGQGALESAPIQGLGKILGGAAHVASAPLRAVSAVGQNLAGTGDAIDVTDSMVYGRDMNTGKEATPYGTLVRKWLGGEEQAGDAPTGYWQDKGLDVIEGVGNAISSPLDLALGVGAAGAASRGVSASADALAASAKSQHKALANVGAAKAAPKIKFNPQTGDMPSASTLLDTDLAAGGSVQNRVYSFPNQMRKARASTSPNQLKNVPPAVGRADRAMAEADSLGARPDFYNEVQGPSSGRAGAIYRKRAASLGEPVPLTEAQAQEMMLREGFMSPDDVVRPPSAVLDTDLVRGLPALSEARAADVARMLDTRGPGTGLGPGAAWTEEEFLDALRRSASRPAGMNDPAMLGRRVSPMEPPRFNKPKPKGKKMKGKKKGSR